MAHLLVHSSVLLYNRGVTKQMPRRRANVPGLDTTTVEVAMYPQNTTSMPRRVKDLTGQRFGRLFVISFSHTDKNDDAVWNCLCDCGNLYQGIARRLRSGNTRSCGCLCIDVRRALKTKHGLARHPLYDTYHAMLMRCYDLRHVAYKNYGGRGITVCDRWRESFANFLEDMGDKPEGYTLDRIDNDCPYTPENCRWATREEQQSNRQGTRLVTYAGQTLTVAQWARVTGVPASAIYHRIDAGWPIERSLTQPPKKIRRRKSKTQ